MPNSALATISAQQALSSSEVIRRWLVVFGELYRQTITSALVEMWETLLADLPPDMLDRACQQVAKTVKFFPTPADVRSQIATANAGGLQLEAEQKWQQYVAWLREWYDPNLGVGRRAPALESAVEFAARAAGGHHWLERCPEAELQWARKRFVETYTRLYQTRQVEHLLTSGEAKRILEQLAAGPPQRPRHTLAATDEDAEVGEWAPTEEEVRAFRAQLNRIAQPKATYQPLDEQEWERRRAQGIQRLEQRLAERGKLEQYRTQRAQLRPGQGSETPSEPAVGRANGPKPGSSSTCDS